MTEGSLQETFQKLLKAEEIVKERERRINQKGSEGREFQNKYRKLQHLNLTALIVPICQQSNMFQMWLKKGHLARGHLETVEMEN